MRTFPIRNVLAGLASVGLLIAGACKQSDAYQTSPQSNPATAPSPGTARPDPMKPDPMNPVPSTGTNPGSPNHPTYPSGSDPSARTAPAPGSARNELPAAQLPEARKALNEIRQINALEIAAGKLADERASSDEVKSFARQLVEDHQNADKKVVEFATKHNVTLPPGKPSMASTSGSAATTAAGTEVPPVALDAKSKRELAKLHSLRGAKFDREFASTMAKGHQEALDLLKTEKNKVDYDEFDMLLTDIQASVEKHLDHAKKLQHSGARSAAPIEERTMQGRRPVRTPMPDPHPTLDPRAPNDPTRVPGDPTRSPIDPTGNPDPTRVPDPTGTRPSDPGSPTPSIM